MLLSSDLACVLVSYFLTSRRQRADASVVFSLSDLFPKRAETTPTRQKIPRLGFFPFGLPGLERLSGPILSGFPPLILFLIYAHEGSFPRFLYTLGCHYRRHERGQRKFLGKDRKYSLSPFFLLQKKNVIQQYRHCLSIPVIIYRLC